jgi:DNA-binding CsgD family transcriptional regulator
MVLASSLDLAVSRLEGIGAMATDHLDAQRKALEVITDLLDVDASGFATVDPATVLWTSCVLRGIPADPRSEAFMFDNEYRNNDLNKIVDLARACLPAGRLSSFDERTREESPRFNMLGSNGAEDELRCALVDSGYCWGSFELYRRTGSTPFTDEDLRIAGALSKPLARMVRMSLLRRAAAEPDSLDEPPGVLLMNQNIDVEAQSTACDRWLEDIGGREGIPPVIRSLVTQLLGSGENSLSTVAPTSSGAWLRLHATRLQSSNQERVSVVIEPIKTAVLPETVARVYGFTSREREIITCIARGESSKEIAIRLGISAYTVNDHAKSIFQKAGVQSRQQLVAALFFDHCLPLRQNDAVPGPYGWFLGSTV